MVKSDIKKRNITLNKKYGNNFLKKIGEKSSITQKKNKKHNRPVNNRLIYIFDGKGNIIETTIFYDLDKLDKKKTPNKRMIIYSLRNKKPIYSSTYGKDKKNLIFSGYHACYEDELYCKITKFKKIKTTIKHTFFYIYDNNNILLHKIKNKQF